LGAGDYGFTAQYIAGTDPNHNDSAVSDCEPLHINKADTTTVTEIHDASENVVTSVPAGSTVHDKATVSSSNSSFNPSGTVTFTFYTSGDCSTGGSPAGTVTIVNGVAHPSNSEGPLVAGAYSFQATYAGDGNFNGSTSACEPLTVTPVGQGCTPGYWKNHQDSWPFPYTPNTLLASVFTIPSGYSSTITGATFIQALNFSGGPGTDGAAQTLLRAAVSGLLSAAAGLNYPLTQAEIISQVNTALASHDRATLLALASTLDADNNLPCPLN
jgi:hypothetical protein